MFFDHLHFQIKYLQHQIHWEKKCQNSSSLVVMISSQPKLDYPLVWLSALLRIVLGSTKTGKGFKKFFWYFKWKNMLCCISSWGLFKNTWIRFRERKRFQALSGCESTNTWPPLVHFTSVLQLLLAKVDLLEISKLNAGWWAILRDQYL